MSVIMQKLSPKIHGITVRPKGAAVALSPPPLSEFPTV